jgi:hypothetical protein
MSLELNPVFDGAGLQLGPVFDVAGVPVIGTVTPGETSVTFTYTGPATHYRLTPLDTGVPGAAVSIPASPVTVTGLTANREYLLEIGPNSTTWVDSEEFGTENPGTGGGTIPSVGGSSLDIGFSVRSAGLNTSSTGYAVRAGGSSSVGVGFEVLGSTSGSSSVATGFAVQATGNRLLNAGYSVAFPGVATSNIKMTLRPRVSITLKN